MRGLTVGLHAEEIHKPANTEFESGKDLVDLMWWHLVEVDHAMD